MSKSKNYTIQITRGIKIWASENSEIFYAKIGHLILYDGTEPDLEWIKRYAVDELNLVLEDLSLPPITIEQITFVEV